VASDGRYTHSGDTKSENAEERKKWSGYNSASEPARQAGAWGFLFLIFSLTPQDGARCTTGVGGLWLTHERAVAEARKKISGPAREEEERMVHDRMPRRRGQYCGFSPAAPFPRANLGSKELYRWRAKTKENQVYDFQLHAYFQACLLNQGYSSYHNRTPPRRLLRYVSPAAGASSIRDRPLVNGVGAPCVQDRGTPYRENVVLHLK
jgi:hypothetical protein